MPLLWFVTLIWAFSFSLIGEFLVKTVDPYLAVSCRMLLALLLFSPWLVKTPIRISLAAKLAAIGAVQLGLMYILLYHSFLLLSVAEVLLFTIFTPIYISVLDYVFTYCKTATRTAAKQAVWPMLTRWLGPALLAVIGAGLIRYQQLSPQFWFGFAIVQGANLCFAFGQVAYRQLNLGDTRQQAGQFGWFFVGAALVSVLATLLFANFNRLPGSLLDIGILLWLGIVASGIGYWLWNAGARQVTAQQLAVMNNVLIPAGLLVNFALWQHQVNWLSLIIGSVLMVASLLWANRYHQQQS